MPVSAASEKAVSEEIGAVGRRTRSPRGQGEQLRDEILAVSERMLIETNDESTLSIRAIASAVGVTPPSIYLHFSDRNELLFAVCERQAEHLERVMDEAAAGAVDPWDSLRRRGYAYLRWGLENPEHYRILMMSRPDATPDRFVDERLADTTGLDAVVADVAAAMAAGSISSAEEPVHQAELLWMIIHGMVSLLISKPGYPFRSHQQVYEAMFDLVHRGLAPRT